MQLAAMTLFTVALLPLSPAGAFAEGTTVRSLVEAQCGVELAAYEEALIVGSSMWQGRVGIRSLDPSNASANQVGVWLGSAYPVIDAGVLARSRLRPEQRADLASQLGRALDLTRCLQPNSAQLDAYKKDGPVDAAKEIKSVECILQGASTLHEALLSHITGDELRALASGQTKAASACEVVQ